jgi:hypothetical protein
MSTTDDNTSTDEFGEEITFHPAHPYARFMGVFAEHAELLGELGELAAAAGITVELGTDCGEKFIRFRDQHRPMDAR